MMNRAYNKGISILEVLLSIIIISFVLVLLFSLLSQVRNESVRNNISSTFIMTQSLLEELITNDVIDYGVKSISSCDIYNLNGNVVNKNNIVEEEPTRCIRIEFAKEGIKSTVGYIMIYKYYTRYVYDSAGKTFVGKKGEKDPYEFTEWAISYVKGFYTNANNTSSNCLFNFETIRENDESTKISYNDCDKGEWHLTQQTLRSLPDDIKPTVTFYPPNEGPTTPRVNYAYSIARGRSGFADLIVPIETIDGERYDLNIPFSFNYGRKSFMCVDTSIINGTALLDCNNVGKGE